MPNGRRTIEDIEGDRWTAPRQPSTRLIEEVHRLRRVPIADLTVENLRLLTAQAVALPIVVPLAIQHLEENPLAAGDLFEGDLLNAVSRLPADFWTDHPDLGRKFRALTPDQAISAVEP